ncbi:MAG: PDZ domain-containing protein, partial [Acidobacteriota bacterium]
LTRSQGVREHSPSWSPDGQWIAYLSDASGEYELYLLPRSGGEPRQLTNDGEVWRFAPVWSPDSKRLAYADRKRRLMVVDVATGEQTEADTAHRGDFAGYTFSPDGHWLVYQRVREDSRLLGISLYSIDKAKTYRLGDGLTAEFAPTWSADGKYLFFFSNRDFNLEFSAFEFNYIYNRATRVYAAALDPDAPALFPLRSDEETGASDDGNGDEDSEGKDDGAETLAIDPLGFADRTIALPGVPPGNFGGLAATADAVYFLQEGDGQPFDLQRYDLSKRKAETVASGVAEFELSASGKTILYTRPNGDMHLVDAKPGASGNGKLDLSGLRMKINPRAEWRQMFDDAWRISRDFFYDPNMHGMDWDALGERYRSLLPSVSHRSELDFILGELVGELAAGHTYVANGEVDGVERIEGGMLGAEFEAGDGGRYRISRIYSGENWHDDFRSPLTEPGVNVDEGDYLLAVDGEELRTDDNPFRLLEGKGERVVTLTVNDRPSRDGAREVLVRPIESELNLRYIDWVKSRIALVDELSGGRIGYIHLPDTAIDGNRMMQKLFYGQANKDALIVDDRYNGGGFIPDRMIEYLTRKNMAYWAMRDIDSMRTPNFAHDGPKVMLMNGYSSSGGDALPYFFRQQGLGPLVGSRTWGGLIGLNGNPPLADGGMVQLCTFRIYDDEGNWVVENEGVEPDVEIFDTPEGLADGGDPSIEKAVEILLDQLQRTPVKRPVIPEPPDLGPGR